MIKPKIIRKGLWKISKGHITYTKLANEYIYTYCSKYSPPSALKANGVLGMNARNYNIIAAVKQKMKMKEIYLSKPPVDCCGDGEP